MPELLIVKRENGKWKVVEIHKGEVKEHTVDDIYLEKGHYVVLSPDRGRIITEKPCRVEEVEILPHVKRKVFMCTDKSVEEIKDALKYF